MDRQLTGTVRGIKTTAESVTVASREIASGNMDLSARVQLSQVGRVPPHALVIRSLHLGWLRSAARDPCVPVAEDR